MKESMEEDMEAYDNEPPFTDIAILKLLKLICNDLLDDNAVRTEMIDTIDKCIKHLLMDRLIGYLVCKKLKEMKEKMKEMNEEQGGEGKNEGLNALLLLKGLLKRRLLKRLRR